jgi:hypothetical protein
MGKLEAILKEAESLSPNERAKLIAVLSEQVQEHCEADDAAVGRHGLAAWTESTSEEDWSDFYPSGPHEIKGDRK